MKIDRIEWFEVNQFVHQEMVNSPEYAQQFERWDTLSKFLVRLNTDEGHYGVGETMRGAGRDELEVALRLVLGVDPLALNLRDILGSASALRQGGPKEERPVAADHGLFGGVYNAVEVAVFDLVGRVRGMRVCELLGGCCRDDVLTSYWAGLQNPDYSVTAAAAARDNGYGCLKIKITPGMDVVARIDSMLEVAHGPMVSVPPPEQGQLPRQLPARLQSLLGMAPRGSSGVVRAAA